MKFIKLPDLKAAINCHKNIDSFPAGGWGIRNGKAKSILGFPPSIMWKNELLISLLRLRVSDSHRFYILRAFFTFLATLNDLQSC